MFDSSNRAGATRGRQRPFLLLLRGTLNGRRVASLKDVTEGFDLVRYVSSH